METSNGSLLNLETKIERKHITIDGKAYMLRQLAEFSLIDRHTFAQHGRAMSGLDQLGKEEAAATKAVEKAAEGLRATFLRIVIDAEEIEGKLTDEQKLAVLNCFFQQAGIIPAVMDPNITGSTITLSQPPDSNDSTAAVPVTG